MMIIVCSGFKNKFIYMKKKAIIYWAETDLAFVKICNKEFFNNKDIKYKFIRLRHHNKWFTKDKNFVLNLFWFMRQVIDVIFKCYMYDVIIFGTNICRILFPISCLFGKKIYVYNEIPEKKKGVLYYYDKFLIRSVRLFYVSSLDRLEYIRKKYGRSASIGIICNTPIIEWDQNLNDNKNNKMMYAGIISEKRFSKNILDIIKSNNLKIDVYGKIVNSEYSIDKGLIEYCGYCEHDDMLNKMKEYTYGLVSYYTEEVNYDLCAPIKIYEYVAAGCVIVSIKKNKGLLYYFERYPELFVHINEFNKKINIDQYLRQREDLLLSALENNKKFVKFFYKI
jgi:hypothetical protein